MTTKKTAKPAKPRDPIVGFDTGKYPYETNEVRQLKN